ncbi:MAG: DUF1566 domain-containing protein, partial [Desulfobulbaceae bacterium]|nr:DUF1566 domain-containing protein [Desulfobulbaceae bacterium]
MMPCFEENIMVQVIINGVKFFCLYAKGIGFLSQRVGLTLALSFLVVALPAISFAAYTDNADGTVTDTSTGLTWKHCAEGQTWSGTTCSGGQIKTYTWAQANALSNTVTFAGHSDWRVPTISELESIIESYFPTTPAINEQVFPNKSNNIFWSSTTDSANANNGMYVNFVYGVTSPMDKALPIAAAHLVRGGGSTPGAGIVTFDLILERGWNLVGNSLDQTLSVGTIFDDPLEVDTVWKWDSATSKWQFYSPEMTAGELLAYSVSKGFAVMSEIKSGEGYWVNAVIKNTLPTQTGAPYILSADDLVVGWNLVSTAESLTPSEFNLALSDNPPGFAGVPNNLTTLWAWDRLSGKWYFYAPSLEAQGGTALLDYIVSKGFLDFTQNSKTLGKGIGFWVNKTSQPLTVAQPTLSLAMTANNGTTPVTSVSNTDPALVTATVLDSDGKPVANAIVTFTVDELYGAFSGGANTALTNVNGLATVKLTTTNTSGGASTLQANTTVNGTSATASLNYAIGSTVLSLSSISVPATSLSAYGTASVSVGVLVNGALYTTPIAVSFTSACATSGKATLTPSVTTVNGTATASYRDNGCNNGNPGDTITATLLNGVTATANLKVSSPATGSLQFVSVVTNPLSTPPMITLKGTGGTNKSETAKVTFRVVDSAGYPLGNTLVTFSLNTSLGGLSLLSS